MMKSMYFQWAITEKDLYMSFGDGGYQHNQHYPFTYTVEDAIRCFLTGRGHRYVGYSVHSRYVTIGRGYGALKYETAETLSERPRLESFRLSGPTGGIGDVSLTGASGPVYVDTETGAVAAEDIEALEAAGIQALVDRRAELHGQVATGATIHEIRTINAEIQRLERPNGVPHPATPIPEPETQTVANRLVVLWDLRDDLLEDLAHGYSTVEDLEDLQCIDSEIQDLEGQPEVSERRLDGSDGEPSLAESRNLDTERRERLHELNRERYRLRGNTETPEVTARLRVFNAEIQHLRVEAIENLGESGYGGYVR